jgi:hypothetical protein
MANNTDAKGIRLEKVPQSIHSKLKRYCAVVLFKSNRKLNKATAAIELLNKVTDDQIEN